MSCFELESKRLLRHALPAVMAAWHGLFVLNIACTTYGAIFACLGLGLGKLGKCGSFMLLALALGMEWKTEAACARAGKSYPLD